MTLTIDIRVGHCLDILRTMPDESVQCCVTSPPYWGLRDYGVVGQMGSEPTPEEYVANMVEVFEEVRRVLKADGTAWVNMGDSYASNPKDRTKAQSGEKTGLGGGLATQFACRKQQSKVVAGLKPKDLCGMPWRLAFGLQEAGWYLRSDIIWHKPNPMPESVTDRPTKAHEYIFLLSKNARYYYDIDAIREPASWNTHERQARALLGHKSVPDENKNGIRPKKVKAPDGWDTTKGQGGHGTIHKRGRDKGATRKLAEIGSGTKNNASFDEAMAEMPDTRNKRDVWSVNSAPFPEAHFATFPPDLIKPCILAGCMGGGVVLDPFGGSGTTGLVALELGRNAILIELNPEYAAMARRRCTTTHGLNL